MSNETSAPPEGAGTLCDPNSPFSLTDEERIKLQKFLARHSVDALMSRWAGQWNKPRSTAEQIAQIKPILPLEMWKLGRNLTARAILLSGAGRTASDISEIFCDEGLVRPVRPGLAKPLIGSSLVSKMRDSWLSSRGIGLSIAKRLLLASRGQLVPPEQAMPPIEGLEKILQERWAAAVSAWWPGPRPADGVPALPRPIDETQEEVQLPEGTPAQALADGAERPNSGPSTEGWITATEARKWAKDGGIEISLATMGRHKNGFRWQPGEGKSSYQVELESFDKWVRDWWRSKTAKKTAGNT